MSADYNEKAIVLLSGGLDSSTVLAIVDELDYDVYALSFSYGQRNNFEISKAKDLADRYGAIEHKIIELDLGIFSGSSLTSEINVEKNRDFSEIGSNIPSTYVPLRNTIFITYALAWAETLSVENIFIGVNAVDHSGYPDCRPEYIEAFNNLANLATKMSTESGKKIEIKAPLLHLNKSEIIRIGLDLSLDYSMTETCYDPLSSGLACGECDSCRLRQKAFNDIGELDPLPYNSRL